MLAWTTVYSATALTFLALDAIWLSITASRLYRPELGPLLLDGFRPLPAAAFYLIYVTGILIFAIAPALATGRRATAPARGAMLGLLAYATYDLTNQATLRGWSTIVTVADLCWGTTLTGIAATVGFMTARRMFGRVSGRAA